MLCQHVLYVPAVCREGGALPEGVIPQNDSLLFGRPLSLTDAGTYQCVAKNVVGVGKGDMEVIISGKTTLFHSYSCSFKHV